MSLTGRYVGAAGLLVLTLFHVDMVSAMEVNIATMMQNLSQTVPQLMQLLTAVAYVMGMGFTVKGILDLKKYGESRTQMSTNADLRGALIFLFIGAALLYLPTTVHVGLSTFWKSPNPYQYIDETQDAWGDMLKNVFMIIQLIGTFAFIKGLVVLTQLSGHHGQPGTVGKAAAHIIGGVLCINIYQFVAVVTNTLALGQ